MNTMMLPPYGITNDNAYIYEETNSVMWFDKKQMIEIGKQIYDLLSEEIDILNKSAE